MDMSRVIQDLYQYNYWANHRYLAAAEALNEGQLKADQGHSWGSVHGILLHMLGAEWIWLKRWKGESPTALLRSEDFPTLSAIREYWQEQEAEMRLFVSAQDPDSLQREVAYANTRGEKFHLPLWQMMLHVVNHSTHHRGELAAMLALMNVAHPEDEAYHFFLEIGGQRKGN